MSIFAEVKQCARQTTALYLLCDADIQVKLNIPTKYIGNIDAFIAEFDDCTGFEMLYMMKATSICGARHAQEVVRLVMIAKGEA